jgi:hypothetical protein
MKTSMDEMWKHYAKLLMPADAGEHQKLETELAFKSGMYALYCKTKEIAQYATNTHNKDLLKEQFDEWRNEYDMFCVKVVLGKIMIADTSTLGDIFKDLIDEEKEKMSKLRKEDVN